MTGTRAASDAPASPEALENRIAEIAAVGVSLATMGVTNGRVKSLVR